MANTYVDYTATAGQTDFNFSFPYLENDHVEVFIDGVESTAFTISLSPTRVVLDTAATGGETVRVRRSSDPTEDLVDFVNGSILTESDLDRAYLHNRYLNEEAYEGNTSSLQTAAGSTNFDANFNKIINLAPPTNSLDAANKDYVDDKLALSGTSLSGFNKSKHTGDNATTAFTLSFTAQTGTAAAFRVAIDGVLQTPDDAYTVNTSTNQITFTSAPPTNAEIVVIATGTAQDVNSIGVTATGSTTARSLADRFADVVNVLDFGAKGDYDPVSNPTADDTTAIQNAIDSGFGRVYFPAGTYRVTSKINYNGCGLLGAGNDKTTIQCDASGVNFEKTVSLDRSAIEGIAFLGNGSNEGFGHGSNTRGWYRSVIRDCRFADFNVCARIQNAVILRIEGCDFSDGPLIFEPVGTPDDYNNNVTLINCFFRDVSASAGNGYACDVNMPAEFEGNNFNFIGCACDDSYSGIRIKNARAVFNNCSWERHTNYFVVADDAQVSFNSGYFLGEAGAGTANIFALRNGAQALLTGLAKFVDNFQYYIDATGGSSFVSTVNQFNSNDYTLDATSTYGESLPREYTYTPTVYGDSTTGTGTYTAQVGRYTRVGNLIHFTVRIVWTAHTGIGGMRISLPIDSVNTSGQRYSYPVYMAGATFTGSPIALILENSDHIRVRQNVSGGAVTNINLPSAGEVVITGTYEVL